MAARARKMPPDFRIIERRRQEDARAHMVAHVNAEFTAKTYAEWEVKTNDKIVNNHARSRYVEMRSRAADELEGRRQRLAALLEQEQSEYLERLQSLQPTADQRRQEMETRARQLREERESVRREVVEEKLRQRFRNECDELRGEQAKIIVDEVKMRWEEQRQEQEAKQIRLKEEEQFFNELWEADRLRKIAREQQEHEQRSLMAQETMLTLDEQIAHRQQLKDAEQARDYATVQKLKESWSRAAQEAEAAEKKRHEHRIKTREELDRFNTWNRGRKEDIANQERARDLELIRNMVAQQQAAENEAAAKKAAAAQDSAEYREHLMALMQKDAANEEELDQLRAEERAKVERKQDERWSAERAARHRLMAEVTDERARQMQIKYERWKEEREVEMAEGERLRREAAEHARKDQEAAQGRKMAQREYRQALGEQRGIVDHMRRRDVDDRMMEAAAAAEAERIYKLRIEEERRAAAQRPTSYGRKKMDWYD